MEGVRGLERLVSKIGEMRVGRNVRDDVFGAVGELEEVSRVASFFVDAPCFFFLSFFSFFLPSNLSISYLYRRIEIVIC